MKKIINAVIIIIDFIVDFLYLSRLMFEINIYKNDKQLTYNHLRVFLQFTGNAFDNSAFELYNLNKEDDFYIFYLSIKKRKNVIYQCFCFFHCFIFNYLIYQLLFVILPKNKILNRIWNNINEFFIYYLKNNYTVKKLYTEIRVKTKWFIRDLFLVKLIWVTYFLIKNKGQFEVDMQEDWFNNEYYVDKDNEDNYIKTTIKNLIDDIYNSYSN